MQKIFFTVVLFLTFGGLFSPEAFAQAPTATGPTPTPASPAPAAVPLDGGASLLLASGVAYGLRRLQQRKRRT